MRLGNAADEVVVARELLPLPFWMAEVSIDVALSERLNEGPSDGSKA